MDWRKFLLYNALGAATWVTSIAMIGFAFANQFNTLLGYLEDAAWAMAAGIFTLGYLLWRKQKKRFKERQRAEQTT
jgi:membrane protein DedA with SNARE-associated domain